ncbi:MAG: T9SS type A sorting domain-containing protein, partial [Ignavibacteria bacterium]|nr:T9SS type A sorting domain-containing protein [Ignavibacteria bacterium]
LSGSLDTVDIGESADDITAGNGQLLIVSRLGGRRIIRQNISSGNLTWFRAGNSPCEIEFDLTRNRIYVLNAFESSVSRFNASDYSLISTLNLPVNQSRSDAIPWMHYDSALSKLFISFPEFNKILIVNCNTFTVESSFSVPGFNFNQNSHKAPGILQTATASNHNRLFVFQKIEKKLKVFSTLTYNFIDSIDVSSFIPSDYGVFTADILFYDVVSNTLFIGNKAVDPVNYNLRGTVALGRRVIGFRINRNLLYSADVKGDSIFVYENNPLNFSLLNIRFLFKTENAIGSPVFKYDPSVNDLFITDYNYPVIRHYDMDSLSPIGIINNGDKIIREFEIIRIYPNPFNPSFNIDFKIEKSTKLTIKLYDASGKETEVIYSGFISEGNHAINHKLKNKLASGIYFCRFEAENFSETFKTVYIK